MTYDDLMAHITRHSPYTSKESYSITWLRQSIMNLLTNYKYGFFTRTGVTESDVIFRVWSSIQYAYEDTIISVNSGEKEIQATSNNNNANRSLGKRKLHGTRVDLRFVYDGAELGCAEAGRSDEGELGTKELNESNLKCPKTLRDMYVLLLKKYPDKQNEISTFGFILMGLSVFILVMDSPGGTVCRVSRSPRYQVSTDIRAFSTRVIPLLQIFLQVKKTMLKVVSQITTSSIPTLTLGQSNNVPIPYSISSSSSKSASSKTTPKKQRTGSSPTSGSSAT
ncbi:hypothetical protein BDC45DRAFT_513116 [Circinella umbellata]|nr:hypothetical protein BDC45DRAFT_513116 [Circinella umbellata]